MPAIPDMHIKCTTHQQKIATVQRWIKTFSKMLRNTHAPPTLPRGLSGSVSSAWPVHAHGVGKHGHCSEDAVKSAGHWCAGVQASDVLCAPGRPRHSSAPVQANSVATALHWQWARCIGLHTVCLLETTSCQAHSSPSKHDPLCCSGMEISQPLA